MEHQIYILVVEDELEVMDALVNDLEKFEDTFPVETANTSEEAKRVAEQIYSSGDEIGLILCDHVLPGENGVDFLIKLKKDERSLNSRKVLVTGQAGLEDTIQAINNADLNYYIAKPWTREKLHDVVVDELTEYVIKQNYDPMKFMSVLDSIRLADVIRSGRITDR